MLSQEDAITREMCVCMSFWQQFIYNKKTQAYTYQYGVASNEVDCLDGLLGNLNRAKTWAIGGAAAPAAPL